MKLVLQRKLKPVCHKPRQDLIVGVKQRYQAVVGRLGWSCRFGDTQDNPTLCCSMRLPGANICEKRSSQWSFRLFQVAWNRLSPIPSRPEAFFVFRLIMAARSPSDVRGLSRASHHSSDRRENPSSAILLMLSSATGRGLYLSRREVLNTFTMPFVVDDGIPLTGSCTEVIVHCTLLHRRLIGWKRVFLSVKSASVSWSSMLPSTSLAAYRRTILALIWLMVTILSSWGEELCSRSYRAAW